MRRHPIHSVPFSGEEEERSSSEPNTFEKKGKMSMPSMSIIVMVVLGSAVVMLLNSKRVITATLLEERDLHLTDLETKDAAVMQAKAEKDSLTKGYKELEDLKNKISAEKSQCDSKLSGAEEKAAQVDIKQAELEEKSNELDNLKVEMENMRRQESQLVQEKENALQVANAEREKATSIERTLQEANSRVGQLEAQVQGEQAKLANVSAELAKQQQAAAAAQQQQAAAAAQQQQAAAAAQQQQPAAPAPAA